MGADATAPLGALPGSSAHAAALELTFESAFSGEGALGHAAYLLLVVSMLMRRMIWLRLLVIASALVAIAYAALILTDPVSTMWETMLVIVNVAQLSLTWWIDRRTQFDARESRMKALHFPALPPHLMRRLLKAGHWRDLPAGTRLATAGAPVEAAYFLHDGGARVEVGKGLVGHCTPGEPAFADVVLDRDSVVWEIEADTVRWLMGANPVIGQALEAAFFRVIRQRLADSNARIAGARDVPADRPETGAPPA